MAFQWSLAALETLMAEDQMDQHAAVLRGFSVVELWRLRRVCRAFDRWCTSRLSKLSRPLSVGGLVGEDDDGLDEATGVVEHLDLSTMRWASGGAVPALPTPRCWHTVCAFGGRVVTIGGESPEYGENADELSQTALRWERGGAAWTPLPDVLQARKDAASVGLADGRAMLIGGLETGHDDDDIEQRPLASVEALAADGSGWSDLTPMGTSRLGPAATVLPCGKVLVAGGRGTDGPGSVLRTAEVWDPATGSWSDLPPMICERWNAGACVLPSGRIAVVGGMGGDGTDRADGEVFDQQTQTWQPLPPMAHGRIRHGVAAVAGGMLAVGGDDELGNPNVPNELFDEASGRWFALPHAMVQPRAVTRLVSLPAAALAPPAPAAGGGEGGGGAAAAAAAAD